MRKADRETILKMHSPKLFIGLIYFQSTFQWDVGESWNNVSVIFQKICKKILKTVTGDGNTDMPYCMLKHIIKLR